MNIFGWDTVYAASIDCINRSLASNPLLLLSEFSFPIDQNGQGQGKFGVWKIVKGGSGKLLHLDITIANGTFTLGPYAPDIELADISIQVEVALQFLPAKIDNNVYELCFDITHLGKQPGKTAAGEITPLSLKDPHNRLSFEAIAILPTAIAECLIQHVTNISYVFATLNPSTGSSSWLNPVASGYFYYESSNADYLVILSLTENTDISQLNLEIDASLVDGSPQAAFAFSKQLFLRRVIEPVLPAIYGHGSSDATFAFNDSDASIVNTTTVSTDQVKSGAIWYSPEINGIKTTVDGSNLVTAIHGSCSMGLGINLSFALLNRNVASVDAASGHLKFAADPNPIFSHDASIPWYDWFLGPLPDALMAIIVPLVANGIANGIQNQATQFTVAKNPPESIHWTGLEHFQMTDAGLNEAFYLQGNIS